MTKPWRGRADLPRLMPMAQASLCAISRQHPSAILIREVRKPANLPGDPDPRSCPEPLAMTASEPVYPPAWQAIFGILFASPTLFSWLRPATARTMTRPCHPPHSSETP